MGIKRVVDVQFWNDDKVIEKFSPEDKFFMLYLMTNPHTTQLGVYAINVKHMEFELGYSKDTINVLLERFEKKYDIIKYSYKTKEIAIKNYLRYSIIKGGKPVEDCLMKEIGQIKDKSLLKYIHDNLKDCDSLNASVKKILIHLNKYDNEYDNENDNDNDNEESSTNRPRIVKKKKSSEYDSILSSITNDLLKKTLYDFIEMRKVMKKPLTTRALELLIKKLNELATNDNDKILILEQSILNNWQGVFPLKDNASNSQPTNEYSDVARAIQNQAQPSMTKEEMEEWERQHNF